MLFLQSAMLYISVAFRITFALSVNICPSDGKVQVAREKSASFISEIIIRKGKLLNCLVNLYLGD